MPPLTATPLPPAVVGPAPTSLSLPGRAIAWEKLPADFVLPDDPVDNLDQIPLGSALSNLLVANGCLPPQAMTCTRYALVAKLDGRTVVKAPDWAYIPEVRVPREQVLHSYTPHLEGTPPALVAEFLSPTEGEEYSKKPSYPPGKWFFYEQILKVPTYVVFNPASGQLEVYRLNAAGLYEMQTPDANGRYWIEELNLFLGLWEGTWQERTGLWLRWWTPEGVMLPFTSEKLVQEQERAQAAEARAEAEAQRAEQAEQAQAALAAQLRSMVTRLHQSGWEIDRIAEITGLPVAQVQRLVEEA